MAASLFGPGGGHRFTQLPAAADLANLQAQFQTECVERLPPGCAMCCVSVVDLEPAGIHLEAEEAAEEGGAGGWIMVSRIANGKPPLTLLLPPWSSEERGGWE